MTARKKKRASLPPHQLMGRRLKAGKKKSHLIHLNWCWEVSWMQFDHHEKSVKCSTVKMWWKERNLIFSAHPAWPQTVVEHSSAWWYVPVPLVEVMKVPWCSFSRRDLGSPPQHCSCPLFPTSWLNSSWSFTSIVTIVDGRMDWMYKETILYLRSKWLPLSSIRALIQL